MIHYILKFLLSYIKQDIYRRIPIKQEKQEIPNLITREEILMGRDKEFPLTPELESNLVKLSLALNKFRVAYGKPLIITSGYRPSHYNSDAGGAKKSNHCLCRAVDFADKDRSLMAFCISNLKLLEDCGLWMENPAVTKSWIHLQIVPPKSGNRIFNP